MLNAPRLPICILENRGGLFRREASCPLCGGELKHTGGGRFRCGNRRCPIIGIRLKSNGPRGRILLNTLSRRVKRKNAA